MLWRAELYGVVTRSQLTRYVLGYWFFYRAGICADLAEHHPGDFWPLARELVRAPGIPRGTERRHFRGKAALNAIESLALRYPNPLMMVDALTEGLEWRDGGFPFREVARRAMLWPQFGPWIAFKVADMLDRCLGLTVNWSSAELALYDTPRQGAFTVARQWKLISEAAIDPLHGPAIVSYVVSKLTDMFAATMAPPGGDRPVGTPEVETILCKYKSHLSGHYPMGKDTREIHHALVTWDSKPDDALCYRLAELLPGGPRP